MRNSARYDLIVYGASGFTGRLVAEHLSTRYGVGGEIAWAMAGRSADKLAQVRDEIGAPGDTPLIVADADDPASLDAMVGQTKAVITTVGPYQLYGSQLVAACTRAGTDYLDLCGEPPWMRRMIDAHEAEAKASGARIVFSCGFDSIPFELGVLFVQTAAVARFRRTARRVKGRPGRMQGGVSGGTVASLGATLAAAARDPAVVELLKDPFSLTPEFRGPAQPLGNRPEFDEDLQVWTAPFVMAPINTRNIHRSNALMGHPYGTEFVYDEMVVTGPGEAGRAAAGALATASLGGDDAPKPGEGPSRKARDSGFYELQFLALGLDGERVDATVKGDRDPGYGSTSKLVAESAIHLVHGQADVPGGVWTPGAAMGQSLIDRLQTHAGLTFALV